jgi:putative CocE/NonD family hydrolase
VPFWNEVVAHGTYDDYWKARNLRPHLQGIKPVVLVVGGWFDAENLYGALQLYKTIGSQSPATSIHLVMGPWYHGAWSNDSGERLGNIAFGSKTSDFFQNEIEFPFFVHHLKGGPDPRLPKGLVFETGANRWMRFDSWPPKGVHSAQVYFQPGGSLGFAVPAQTAGFDEFVSDPLHPVPSFEGLQVTMPKEYMTADQRFVANRADVLTYRTAPLDRELTVAGPIHVHLNVSTTGADADWVVKVIDEFPAGEAGSLAGYQQLVRGEVMRGKFRHSLEKPEPFVPGEPTAVEWPLNDIFHSFRRGHRLTVQIQSTWFPLMDRNPQVFMDIYRAKEGDFKPAKHRVYHSLALPSYLELPLLEP